MKAIVIIDAICKFGYYLVDSNGDAWVIEADDMCNGDCLARNRRTGKYQIFQFGENHTAYPKK